MNVTPLISVVIPTYNRRELLEKAILSVIRQNTEIPFSWEIIIVDDWSNDGTRDYINKYISLYPQNITYLFQNNSWVGRARNNWIEHISKDSDYIVFLDSDDELMSDCFKVCLGKWQSLKKDDMYWSTDGLIFFWEDDHWNLIGKDKFEFNDSWNFIYSYSVFLKGAHEVQLQSMLKSSIYLMNSFLRFEEDIVTESVLWSKLYKHLDSKNHVLIVFNYTGYIYRIFGSKNKITQTISKERFRKNAIGNERIIDIIGKDLLAYCLKRSYAEYLFRAWINWYLFDDHKKWRDLMIKSLHYSFSLRNLCVLLCSCLPAWVLRTIYKLYIN